MSLPSPHLDDRKFQDLVDDVKRQIGLRCPEWTEHNVSDPGVTLIELFAFMVEQALFRMNQVPEKNYIKFLEMIGITLEMPQPSRADLRFRLTRPIEDAPGEESYHVTLPARRTTGATIRTETEEAIEFTSDADLRMVRPKVAAMFAIPATEAGIASEEEAPEAARLVMNGQPLDEGSAFKLFSAVPRQNDCTYICFENDVSGNMVRFDAACLTAAATGLRETYPSQVWEVWDGINGAWERLESVQDTTFGFNRTGYVELALPRGLIDKSIAGQRGYWIRLRYSISAEDLPPVGLEMRSPEPYQKSPELTQIRASTVGGTVPASNCTTLFNEVLGQSDGTPGQEFQLAWTPVLELTSEDTLWIGPVGATPDDFSGFMPWTRVDDFSESHSSDCHFAIDLRTGVVQLGPALIQPDGTVRQYGAVPEKGLTLRMSAYRVGGGSAGNVTANKVRVLKTAYPYIAEVSNPRPAAGGRDMESLDRAKLRALEVIKVRNRAVACEDYEVLARKASPGVGRARCIQPLTHPAASTDSIQPGVVTVLIVPALNDAIEVPAPVDFRVPDRTLEEVRAFLDERRLLTAALEIAEPDYVFVSTDIKLVADPRADAEEVAKRVRSALNRFIHPLKGGAAGTGWPFRRTLTLADIYSQVGEVRGVAFLLDAKVFASRILSKDDRVLGAEEVVSNVDGMRLVETEMFATRDHRIRVVPMSAVGADEAMAGSAS